MEYLDFLKHICTRFNGFDIENVRAEKKDTNFWWTIGYNPSRTLIIIGQYKEEIKLPENLEVIGLSRLSWIHNNIKKNKINAFIEVNESGAAIKSILKTGINELQIRHVSPALLPDFPTNLDAYKPEIEWQFDIKEFKKAYSEFSIDSDKNKITLAIDKKSLLCKIEDMNLNCLNISVPIPVNDSLNEFNINLKHFNLILRQTNVDTLNISFMENVGLMRFELIDEYATYHVYLANLI